MSVDDLMGANTSHVISSLGTLWTDGKLDFSAIDIEVGDDTSREILYVETTHILAKGAILIRKTDNAKGKVLSVAKTNTKSFIVQLSINDDLNYK